MKLTIDRSVFLKALSHGQSVVEKRTTIPILSHVLLHAKENALHLTSTDMDLALIETIPAAVEHSGSITVSAHMLFEVVRKLPENSTIELSLNQENGQLTLKAGRSRFNLSTLPAEDFPQLTQDDLPHDFTLPAATLKRLIDRARFAMSVEDTRYYLNGIYLHSHTQSGRKVLRSVATDAHRLACIQAALPEGVEDIPGVIIGRKTVTEIRKLLDETEGNVTVKLSATRVEFALENATLSSRLIDGAYPDYEQAIPKNNDKPLIVDAKAFAAAVDRVATVAADKLRIVKMSVSNNSMTLSAASHELGSATEEVAVDFPHQTPIEIGFNAKYLLDIAQQIGDEEAQIMLADSTSPALIQSMNDQDALFVLMPMRV
jgi:DNA polymerase III subunit beta